MEAADWLPPAGPLLRLILRLCRAASSIVTAIAEFRHLAGSPWISTTRGSSSKRERHEDLERRRRLAEAIDMDDLSTEESNTPAAAAAEPGPPDSGAPAEEEEPEAALQRGEITQPAVEPEPAAQAETVSRPKAEAEAAPQKEVLNRETESERKAQVNTEPSMKSDTACAEQQQQQPAPGEPEAAAAVAENGPELSIAYFRGLLSSETARLSALAGRWEAVAAVEGGGALPADQLGEVRSVIGQARLLIRERFGQFDGLVDSAEFLRGPRPTTLTDLQGFWEMIYFQVEDVDRKFARLARLEAAGWQETVAPAPAPAAAARPRKPQGPAARRPAAKKAAPSSALRAAMMAARRKMKAEAETGAAPQPAADPSPATPAPAADNHDPDPVTAADTDPRPATPAPAADHSADPERSFLGGFFSVATPTVPASPAPTHGRRSALTELSSNTPAGAVRRSRRQPSLLSEPVGAERAAVPPPPPGHDLITFDSPAPAKRKSRRLTAAS